MQQKKNYSAKITNNFGCMMNHGFQHLYHSMMAMIVAGLGCNKHCYHDT